MPATLYGIGVGPGDPELLTIKAAAILKKVHAVAYVAARTAAGAQPSLALAIAAAHLPDGVHEIAVPIVMQGDPAPGRAAYDAAAAEIGAYLDASRDVAFLCEGDPLLYGSFMYVLERLGGRYPVETVPGVSSLSAAAAAAALPLVSRHQSLMIVPATLGPEALQAKIAAAEAAAVFKVGRHMNKVCGVLERLGRAAGALYVEKASTPEARVLPLAEAPDPAPYFSMILVPAQGGDG